MFCPNCGMLKSNCVCGYCKNSGKSISNKQKMHKKVNHDSESKISLSTKKSNKEESIPENIPKTIYLHSSNSKCFSRSSAGVTNASGMKDQLSDALSVTF